MKKLGLILMILFSVSAFAQNMGRGQKMQGNNFSPEEKAGFMSKRMAILLDLTESQQAEVQKILEEKVEEQKAYRTQMQQQSLQTRQQNRAERMNSRLDRQLAFQEQLKKILTEDQFTSWLELRRSRQGINRNQL